MFVSIAYMETNLTRVAEAVGAAAVDGDAVSVRPVEKAAMRRLDGRRVDTNLRTVDHLDGT